MNMIPAGALVLSGVASAAKKETFTTADCTGTATPTTIPANGCVVDAANSAKYECSPAGYVKQTPHTANTTCSAGSPGDSVYYPNATCIKTGAAESVKYTLDSCTNTGKTIERREYGSNDCGATAVVEKFRPLGTCFNVSATTSKIMTCSADNATATVKSYTQADCAGDATPTDGDPKTTGECTQILQTTKYESYLCSDAQSAGNAGSSVRSLSFHLSALASAALATFLLM